MPKERDIIKIIWTTVVNSFKRKEPKGNFMGKDQFGNKYFEVPADPSIGKRKPARWFTPVGATSEELDHFDKEMPAEWEAWLRGRRGEPPGEDEIMRNQAIAEMAKKNAAELEEQRRPPGTAPKAEKMKDFPVYPEYEVRPGDKNN